jgi:hypothetical protein
MSVMSEVYFGVKKASKFFLDKEKTQFIEFKKMNEGERIAFQDALGGKIVLDQVSQKAEVDSKVGSDRKALIMTCVTGFKVLMQEGEEQVEISDMSRWEELYVQMDSDLAEALYEEIAIFNGLKKK